MTTRLDYQGADRQPDYFTPRPNLTQGSEAVEATVKWFNADKGFGFFVVAGGPDAFLPARALEMAGHSSVPDGSRVKVRISQGQKGPQVAEVIEVNTSTAPADPALVPPPAKNRRLRVPPLR